MKLYRHLFQGSPEWLAWRRDGLGGSDVATILGVMPFADCTRENICREKVDGWQKPINFAMRRGNRLEPVARQAYQERTGYRANPVCVEHDQVPWMRVSLDGLCSPEALPVPATRDPLGWTSIDARDRDWWILELKCPNFMVHEWALEGTVTDYYWPQCQYQLLATGLDRLDFASYSESKRFAERDRLAVVSVTPDAELQARLIEECESFWRSIREARERQVPQFDSRFAEETI